jgi:hypothetical protein
MKNCSSLITITYPHQQYIHTAVMFIVIVSSHRTFTPHTAKCCFFSVKTALLSMCLKLTKTHYENDMHLILGKPVVMV